MRRVKEQLCLKDNASPAKHIMLQLYSAQIQPNAAKLIGQQFTEQTDNDSYKRNPRVSLSWCPHPPAPTCPMYFSFPLNSSSLTLALSLSSCVFFCIYVFPEVRLSPGSSYSLPDRFTICGRVPQATLLDKICQFYVLCAYLRTYLLLSSAQIPSCVPAFQGNAGKLRLTSCPLIQYMWPSGPPLPPHCTF